MAEVSIAELRSNLEGLDARARYGDERICITCDGAPIVAIISATELEYFEALEDWFDITEAEKAMAEAEKEGWITWEEYLKEEA